MASADYVRDDVLEVIADHVAGLRGPTREPRGRVTLDDVEKSAVLLTYEEPYPRGELSRFRVRVVVEELGDPEPCQHQISPGRVFLPPEPPEMCDEDAVPGHPYCRTHLEVEQ